MKTTILRTPISDEAIRAEARIITSTRINAGCTVTTPEISLALLKLHPRHQGGEKHLEELVADVFVEIDKSQ